MGFKPFINHIRVFFSKLRQKKDIPTMEMLVLVTISRKTVKSFCMFMYIRHVQIGKYFSTCTVQDSEMCNKPD